MPKVSVIIPSYNHEKYVKAAIESVLHQTYQNFEIIITDDGSQDNTVAEIKKIKDRRIKLFCFKKNSGVSIAINNCLKQSHGQYIAQLNSDDLFTSNKLEKQVKYLDRYPKIAAVFSKAQMIDEKGMDLPDTNHHHGLMNTFNNKDRFHWLNFFFHNCRWLWHPSMMIRRSVYESIGRHDPRYAQIQDFDLGIRLSLEHELYIIPERLVKFRIRDDNSNMSANTLQATVRSMFELGHVLKNFLKIKNTGEFKKIFPNSKKYNDIIDNQLIPFYIARQALEIEHVFHQKFALDIIFNLFSNKQIVRKLNTICNFDYNDLIKLTSKHDLYYINHREYQNNLINKLKHENEELKKPQGRIKSIYKELIGLSSFFIKSQPNNDQ